MFSSCLFAPFFKKKKNWKAAFDIDHSILFHIIKLPTSLFAYGSIAPCGEKNNILCKQFILTSDTWDSRKESQRSTSTNF